MGRAYRPSIYIRGINSTMAEYGLNKINSELAQQYLDELNGLDDGGVGKGHLIGDTAWWPNVADELPHPSAGTDNVPEDATIPDAEYNIKARFDATLQIWVLTQYDTISDKDKYRKANPGT